ncbi:Phytanoyl-CoA dioxygenase (PhyH) [Actinacidiphila yanglinensis]|uniref:Phytanoyl-CoA dioxygenase (PhyH) n=1 Tax=Actinacidiphila yanglinensis TaxID=310779 RepID=A0A1H6AY73_9ACTN|nr:phytanoyl-CoA dioxygenase family protein [Actinacidiphila yanglinensis]SEG52746.1 Phytanoyl-CoA dioxygenase (PhyH) [Actinacidiphila yanglinensis]
MRATFRRQGYLVVPDVLTPGEVAAGRKEVAAMLAKQPPAEGHVGPHFVFRNFGDRGHPLLDFFLRTGMGELAGQLLREGLAIQPPEGVQVATTIPPWPYRPGGPHVDGLSPTEPDGRPGTFSLLAGAWLTDHTTPGRGNLWVWPGTHLRFGAYLAERGADALRRVDDMAPGPYPRIELGDPVQVVGPAGSVLLAHYLLAHNIGDHDGPADDERRETLYYRLHAEGHRDRWREVVTAPLSEFG